MLSSRANWRAILENMYTRGTVLISLEVRTESVVQIGRFYATMKLAPRGGKLVATTRPNSIQQTKSQKQSGATIDHACITMRLTDKNYWKDDDATLTPSDAPNSSQGSIPLRNFFDCIVVSPPPFSSATTTTKSTTAATPQNVHSFHRFQYFMHLIFVSTEYS